MVNFKNHDVTDWTTNNCNTHIPQYLKTQRQPVNQIRSVNQIWSYTRCGGEAGPAPFYKKSKLSISLDQQSEML